MPQRENEFSRRDGISNLAGKMAVQMRDVTIEPETAAAINEPLADFAGPTLAALMSQVQIDFLFYFGLMQCAEMRLEDADQRMRTGFRRADTEYLAASWIYKTITGNFGIMLDEFSG